jgi:hypothetical protein
MSKITFLAVDLDGVCMSMSEAAALAHGVELPLRDIPDDYLYRVIGSKKIFWSKCRGHKFWSEIKPYVWTEKLLKTIDESGVKWCFLSKTSRDSGSSSGKYTSIEKWFPQYLDKLWLARGTKSYMAAPGKGLLDDKFVNIAEWQDAGGFGIHWPELHPSQVDEAEKRIEEIRKILTNGA